MDSHVGNIDYRIDRLAKILYDESTFETKRDWFQTSVQMRDLYRKLAISAWNRKRTSSRRDLTTLDERRFAQFMGSVEHELTEPTLPSGPKNAA